MSYCPRKELMAVLGGKVKKDRSPGHFIFNCSLFWSYDPQEREINSFLVLCLVQRITTLVENKSARYKAFSATYFLIINVTLLGT